jgi:hypothetical protein
MYLLLPLLPLRPVVHLISCHFSNCGRASRTQWFDIASINNPNTARKEVRILHCLLQEEIYANRESRKRLAHFTGICSMEPAVRNC